LTVGFTGSLAKSLAAIDKLMTANIFLQISCPVMMTNYRSYAAVLKWANAVFCGTLIKTIKYFPPALLAEYPSKWQMPPPPNTEACPHQTPLPDLRKRDLNFDGFDQRPLRHR
jgi:hypothetical protein